MTAEEWRRLLESWSRDWLQHLDAAELEEVFAARPLAAWLELLDGEEVCVGPVLTLEEAGAERPSAPAPALGEHTDAWRRELQPGRGSPSAAGSA